MNSETPPETPDSGPEQPSRPRPKQWRALAVLALLVLGVVLWFNYVPKFPGDLPHAGKVAEEERQYLEKQQFFIDLNRFLRGTHGHLVLTGELERGGVDQFARFRQTFNFIDETDLLARYQSFAEGQGMTMRLQKGEGEQATYEVDFLRGASPWVQVKVALEADRRGKSTLAPAPPAPAAAAVAAPPSQAKGNLVLIVDDMGQNMKHLDWFAGLDANLTFSILPHLPYSVRTAEEASKRGHEIMLHLPMQPQDYPKVSPGEGALLLADSPETWTQVLEAALQQVPQAKGINNHMGSAFIQQEAGMNLVMQTLAQRDLFFLDSKTAPGEIARRAALKMSVPYLSRDVFLDDDPAPEKVKAQLQKAGQLALHRGVAIAICHPREATLLALQEELPRLRQQGVYLIRISSLVQQPAADPDQRPPTVRDATKPEFQPSPQELQAEE